MAWLRGRHPEVAQGTVKRTVTLLSFVRKCANICNSLQICVGEISGDCGHEADTRVRTCPAQRGGTFWVRNTRDSYAIWRG